MALIEVSDILAVMPGADEARVDAFLDDALALAYTVAPCLADVDLDPAKAAAAKAVLRQTIMRWIDRGSGVNTQQIAGPFQVSVDQSHGGLFWPSEIQALQGICATGSPVGQKAFAVDMTPELPEACGFWSSSDVFVEE